MLALETAEEETVTGPGGGEAVDEGGGGVVGEEAEDGGCGKDHHRHEVEGKGSEAGEVAAAEKPMTPRRSEWKRRSALALYWRTKAEMPRELSQRAPSWPS
jgi:hypothetical protein